MANSLLTASVVVLFAIAIGMSMQDSSQPHLRATLEEKDQCGEDFLRKELEASDNLKEGVKSIKGKVAGTAESAKELLEEGAKKVGETGKMVKGKIKKGLLDTKETLSKGFTAFTDKVERVKESAKEKLEGARHKIEGAEESAKEKLGEIRGKVEDAKESAGEKLGEIIGKVEQKPEDFEERLHEVKKPFKHTVLKPKELHFTEKIGKIADSVKDWFRFFFTGKQPQVAPTPTDVPGVGEVMKEKVKESWEEGKGLFTKLRDSTVETFRDIHGKAQEKGSTHKLGEIHCVLEGTDDLALSDKLNWENVQYPTEGGLEETYHMTFEYSVHRVVKPQEAKRYISGAHL